MKEQRRKGEGGEREGERGGGRGGEGAREREREIGSKGGF